MANWGNTHIRSFYTRNLFNYVPPVLSEIDDSNNNIPDLSHVTNQISEIKLCENEIEDVLKVINPTKASGPDLINPRLLKKAAPIINQILLYQKSV
jgi:hypothetical protein